MIATLSGRTTREQLERETKDGLVGLLAAYGNEIDKTAAKRLAKTHLIDSLMTVVERMAQDDQAKAAEAEAVRQQTLATEKAEGKVHAALENLLRSVNHVVDAAKKTIAEFQAEVARGHYANGEHSDDHRTRTPEAEMDARQRARRPAREEQGGLRHVGRGIPEDPGTQPHPGAGTVV